MNKFGLVQGIIILLNQYPLMNWYLITALVVVPIM